MNLRLVETAIALFLAFGFAAIGDLIFRRRASNIYEWFESFLAGVGCCATLLFPLSLIMRKFTLSTLAVLVALAAIVSLVNLVRSTSSRTVPGRVIDACRRWREDRVAACILLVIVGSVFAFAIVNLRSSLLWDGFQIWSTKALVLYDHGALGPDPLRETDFVSRSITYPPLIPMYEALVALFRHRFLYEDAKPIFLLFYVTMLLATYQASRSLVSARTALVATAVLALLPAMTMQTNIGGYADMPLAAFLVAAAAACLRSIRLGAGWRSPAPWLIGSLFAVKDEGTILAAVACGSILVVALSHPGVKIVSLLRRFWPAGFVIGSMLAVRMGYVRWIDYPDPAFARIDGAHLLQAIARFPTVTQACAARLFDLSSWGLFWPAALMASGVLMCMGTRVERGVACVTLSGVSIYSGLFVFTNWDPVVHIDSAYIRLLSQLAPVACVALVTGYWRLVETLAAWPFSTKQAAAGYGINPDEKY